MMCFHLSGGAIACKSKTQTVTASSSTEVEFAAAFTAVRAVRHLQFILQELGFLQDGPTEIHIGNQATLQHAINDNQAPAVRIRRLDIRLFSLQDWQGEESIFVVHVARVFNPSDDLTKPLAHCLHARHCRRVVGQHVN